MTHCVSKPYSRSFFSITSYCKYKQLVKNKWFYHHLCLAVTSYSHMDFMLRKLRYGNINWQQETCKLCRKNNSEHLNHEVSMILLKEQQLRCKLGVKETAAGRHLPHIKWKWVGFFSHPPLPEPCSQSKGKLRSSDHQTYRAGKSL